MQDKRTFLNFYFNFSFLLLSCLVCHSEALKIGGNEGAFIVPVLKSAQSTIPDKLRFHNAKTKLSAYTLDGRTIDSPLQPTAGMVLIQRKDAVQMSKGGVYLPNESRERQVVGKVLSVGSPGINIETGAKIPIEVSVGDWIIFGRNEAHNLEYNSKDCAIIRSGEILAKVAENDGNPQPNNILPLGDVVFIKILNQEVHSSGIILAHENKNEAPVYGEVVSVGNGSFDNSGKKLPIDVKVGDKVRFSSYVADEMTVKFGDENFMFIRLRDILAKW